MTDAPRIKHPGDEVAPGTPQSAENTCRRCRGSGVIEAGEQCPDCGGTGMTTELIGDA